MVTSAIKIVSNRIRGKSYFKIYIPLIDYHSPFNFVLIASLLFLPFIVLPRQFLDLVVNAWIGLFTKIFYLPIKLLFLTIYFPLDSCIFLCPLGRLFSKCLF